MLVRSNPGVEFDLPFVVRQIGVFRIRLYVEVFFDDPQDVIGQVEADVGGSPFESRLPIG